MAEPVVARGQPEARFRLQRRRVGKNGKPVSARQLASPGRRAFRWSVRVREANFVEACSVEACRPRCGGVAVRPRGVRPSGFQRKILGRRLRPGDGARKACNRQAKANHLSALNPRPPRAHFYRLLIRCEAYATPIDAPYDHFFGPAARAGGSESPRSGARQSLAADRKRPHMNGKGARRAPASNRSLTPCETRIRCRD